MVALFFCYPFTALCISKGDISASAICYLWISFIFYYYICKPSYASVAFLTTFISLCCSILSANESEVVDRDHEHSLQWLSVFLYVSSEHRRCG